MKISFKLNVRKAAVTTSIASAFVAGVDVLAVMYKVDAGEYFEASLYGLASLLFISASVIYARNYARAVEVDSFLDGYKQGLKKGGRR